MTPPTFETLRYDIQDRIAIVTLSRPERLNAIIPQLRADVVNAFKHADEDDEVQSIILTGDGRGFCAGRDLKAPENSPGRTMTPQQAAASPEFPLILRKVRKPVIAAVNGSLGDAPTLPVAAIGVILGVDRILDMCRTTVNVWGDAVGARIMTRIAPDAAEAPTT